jgi:DnaJ-class molecular chaperone
MFAQMPGGGVRNPCAGVGQRAGDTMRNKARTPIECRDCGGAGTLRLQVGNVVGEPTTCGTCWGVGTVMLCPECKGKGFLKGAVKCQSCIFGFVAPEPHTLAFMEKVKAHNAKIADLHRQAREAKTNDHVRCSD